MKRIRIGNDIRVKLALKDGGQPLAVPDGFTLRLNAPEGSREVAGWETEGGTVTFDVPAAAQEACGSYSATLSGTSGGRQFTVDTPELFKLVDDTALAGWTAFPKAVEVWMEVDVSAPWGAGGGDYLPLRNKPRINGVTLAGDLTLAQLGIQPAGDYALRGEIPDTSAFVKQSEFSGLEEAAAAIQAQAGRNADDIAGLKKRIGAFRLYYTNGEALKAAWPGPVPGDTAWAGTPWPGTVWECTERGVWTDTGQAPKVEIALELEQYPVFERLGEAAEVAT